MKRDTPHILCINPWIYDFAAYDFWSKPMGLLILASILRSHGFRVSYIDCLDRFHPRAPQCDPYARNGRGPYFKEKIAKPAGLEDVDRTFSRYGIRPQWLAEDLQSLPKPDLILVTSIMSYWASGVRETISVIKKIFPTVPVVLGGIYASLWAEHAAAHSGADRVVTGPGEEHILELAARYTGFSVTPGFNPDDLNTYPYPAFDLQRIINYIPLLSSRGCPFSCTYCASGFLNPKRMTRDPAQVAAEIEYWHRRYGISDFAFYDDALLINAENHIIPVLEQVVRSGLSVRFHTPNALHIREISPQVAGLMFAAGFTTLRLGLETTAFDRRSEMDRKVTEKEFRQAVFNLKKAGFQSGQIGAYLLTGLPDQSLSAVEASIRIVKQSGITPVLTHYTPIPHTPMWKQAVASSRYDLAADPVFTNNAVFPCRSERFSWKEVSRLKHLITTEKQISAGGHG